MTDTRTAILGKIRHALDTRQSANQDITSIDDRLQQHRRGPQPAWTEDNVQRFITKVEAAAGTVSRIATREQLIPAIMGYLEQHSLGLNLLRATSILLDDIQWPETLTVDHRIANENDVNVVTEAFAAVAETGSVVLLSGPDSPVTLNFLPENYLCIVQQGNIVGHIEDVWDKIRQSGMPMPRTVNFITGPSRTADVEQTIQMGAHGPRRVHILLLD